MKKYGRITFLLAVTLFAGLVTAIASLHSQNQTNQPANAQPSVGSDDFKSQFPIADYNAPPDNDPNNQTKRQRKNKKYNNSRSPINPHSITVTSHLDWEVGLSALPADKSNAVIVGDVIDAQAYVSEDQTGVYSEFTIRVSEVFKNDSSTPITAGNSITVERTGGRVRFPSGNVALQFTSRQGMPRMGRRYLLFLTRDSSDDFNILTGYELKAGRVELLDTLQGHPMAAYKGMDEPSFLQAVRRKTMTGF